ncbi:MAG: FIST signal transduction protein [Candidatus Nanohaloarchaea archaeon]
MGRLDSSVAHSKSEDSFTAGKEVSSSIKDDIGSPELVFVFSGSNRTDEDLLRGINQEIEDAVVAGCSTGGEISSVEGIQRNSVVMAGFSGEDLEVGRGVGKKISRDPREAGRTASRRLHEELGEADERIYYTVFSTSMTGNSSEVMRGVQEVIGREAEGCGGLAGDDWKMEESYVIDGDELLSDAVSVVGIRTGSRIGHGVRHGLEPSRQRHVVTNSSGNIVHELDGRPAAEIYRELFGDEIKRPEFLMTKPLGMELSDGSMRLRNPLSLNGDSIAFAGEVTEGETVTVMDSPRESIIEAARESARSAVEAAGNPDEDEISAVILHDCVCRWNCLEIYEMRQKEIEAVREVVGEDTPVIGWYTYGEIALPSEECGVHNQTMVTQVFTEE